MLMSLKKSRNAEMFQSRQPCLPKLLFVSPMQIHVQCFILCLINVEVLLDFSLTVKAAPHECVIGTSQP